MFLAGCTSCTHTYASKHVSRGLPRSFVVPNLVAGPDRPRVGEVCRGNESLTMQPGWILRLGNYPLIKFIRWNE